MNKIKVKALPHQFELLKDTSTKILGLVSGFGAGKTHAACHKGIQLATLNPGEIGVILEPTYPLLRDAFLPLFVDILDKHEIEYKLNKADFTIKLPNKSTILMRSMENWERLVGINAAWIIADEFDILKKDIAINAFNKLLGRLRAGQVRQFVITTTPEGFKATHDIFVTNKDDSKRLIQAKTTDNKYLPADYIDSLREQYPPNLLDAYLNGKFVNLTSGSVYSYFERSRHHSVVLAKPNEPLHIGQDFNVGGCCSVVGVVRDNMMHIVDEFTSHDTQGIIENIKEKYEGHEVTIYPDASGNANKTNASKSDIALLRDAGFRINAPSANGRVTDRINSVNLLLSKNELKINTLQCPRITESLEQQAYDKNGDPEKFGGAATIDDWNDALGYLIVRKYGIINNKVSVQAQRFN